MPESPEQLKNKIADLEKEIKRYKFENDLLQAEILQLKRHRFGSKSERCTENGFTQLSLFDDLDAEPVEAPNDDDDNESNVVDIAAHKRKVTKKRSSLIPYLAARSLFQSLNQKEYVVAAVRRSPYAMKKQRD
jgi:hypothetical protein